MFGIAMLNIHYILNDYRCKVFIIMIFRVMLTTDTRHGWMGGGRKLCKAFKNTPYNQTKLRYSS